MQWNYGRSKETFSDTISANKRRHGEDLDQFGNSEAVKSSWKQYVF